MPRHTVLPVVLVALALVPAAASASERFTPCEDVPGLTLLAAARVPCAEVDDLAAAVAARPASEAPAVLAADGWIALRARSSGDAHDLVALRGTAALRIRRDGAAPDLDGWAAGRELLFSARRIVGGRPIPRDTAVCTSAFLVRLRGGRLGGLSAAHCAGLDRRGRVVRRNAGLRRPPEPGIVLGRVRRILTRTAPLDALVLPVPSGEGRSIAAIVDRGLSRPPWVVAGVGRPFGGRRVCFSGRTTGIDRCGRIRGAGVRPAERFLSLRAGLVVRCTTIAAREGDSGGPVFSAPRADGTVHAIGIVTLVVGRRSSMCFTPLAPSLVRLGARLVVAG